MTTSTQEAVYQLNEKGFVVFQELGYFIAYRP